MVSEVRVRKDEQKQAMHAQCEECHHRWPIVYLPMEMGKVARVLSRAHCPACGASSKSIVVSEP